MKRALRELQNVEAKKREIFAYEKEKDTSEREFHEELNGFAHKAI